jgi:hypothetical protein
LMETKKMSHRLLSNPRLLSASRPKSCHDRRWFVDHSWSIMQTGASCVSDVQQRLFRTRVKLDAGRNYLVSTARGCWWMGCWTPWWSRLLCFVSLRDRFRFVVFMPAGVWRRFRLLEYF